MKDNAFEDDWLKTELTDEHIDNKKFTTEVMIAIENEQQIKALNKLLVMLSILIVTFALFMFQFDMGFSTVVLQNDVLQIPAMFSLNDKLIIASVLAIFAFIWVSEDLEII